jgi:deoxyribonuclease-2
MLFALPLLCLVHVTYGVPSCLGSSNTPVDWFIMYKFPVISTSSSAATRAGLAFAYMDSENLVLTTSSQHVNDTMNPLYYTLQQIYAPTSPVAHIMYNDENPVTEQPSSTVGHSKGTAAWDSTGGFWLLHSVPSWPPAGNLSYSFGATKAPTYAQTFLCTTLDAPNINVVFNQWAWTRPGVYSAFMDGAWNYSFPGAASVMAGQKVSMAPWSSIVPLFTRGRLQFTYFAKYTNWAQELYEDLVAPTLGVNLNTATWQNGQGSINSSCAPENVWNVQNIAGISVTTDATWTNSKDHAKWAIADSCVTRSSALWICIGDINRQTGQFNRAGGTMCTRHYQVYSQFQRLITGFKGNCTNATSLCPPPAFPTPSPTIAPTAPTPSSAPHLFPTRAIIPIATLAAWSLC